MPKHSRTTSKTLATSHKAAFSRQRRAAWFSGLAALVAILGTVYLWPTSEVAGPLPASPPAALLVLPTEPEARTVQQLWEESEQVVTQLTEQYPDSLGAHRAAATLYHFLHRHDAVTKHWKRCIALDADDPAPRVWLAKAQIEQGREAEALATLQAAVKAGFSSAEISQELALALQRTNRLAEAEQVARQGLQTYPDHVELWIALGQTQLQLDRLEEAKASFERALRLEPQSHAAHLALAAICNRLGDSQSAKTHQLAVEKLQASRKRNGRPYQQEYEENLRRTVSVVLSAAALEYAAHGQIEEAERILQRSYAIDPSSPDPYRHLASMYHRQGRLADALVVQRRLVEVDPDNAVNHLNVASLAVQLARTAEGEAALHEAARKFPETAAVHRHLAQFYLRGGQLAKAREAAERAIGLERSADGYQLLSAVCRQQGDLAAAAVAERMAIDLSAVAAP